MIIGIAIGLAIIAFVFFYITADIILVKTQAYLVGRQFSIRKDNKNTQLAIGGLIGLVSGILLTNGTDYMTTAGMVFAGLGVGAVEIFHRIITQGKEERRKKECFLLFNAIEIYAQSGYSIPQALANARSFAPMLEPAINKSLAVWPSGSIRALEVLQNEINLPEGDQLVSLLLQINQTGAKNLENVIQAESRQMEEKRKALAKARITQKPVFLMAYRLLPLVVLMGMLAGVLVTRVFSQMNSIL